MAHSDDRDTQLDFLFQTIAEGIVLVDADGAIERLNPAAAAMLALTPDAVGQPAAVVFRHQPGLVRLCTTPGDDEEEVTLARKRPAAGTASDRPGGGRIVLLRDVTAHVTLEARRTALIRQIAHDLRNPLNAVSAYAELVTRFGTLTGDQARYLDRVQQTADKLYELAETLIDLAWVESGVTMEHRPVNVAQSVRAAVHALEAEAGAHNVTLVLSIQDPVPLVLGDPHRLAQAVRFVLENAIRYSPPETNVAVHVWQSGTRVYCSVGDRGIGIRADDIEYIWDRMWRSDDARVRAQPGGGIGLSFARAIIRQHGGHIAVESEAEAGTTVTFWVPLAEEWTV